MKLDDLTAKLLKNMENAFSEGGVKMAYLISEEAQDLLQDVKKFLRERGRRTV